MSLLPTELTLVFLASFTFSFLLYNSLRFSQERVAAYRIFVGIMSTILVLLSFITGRYYNHSFMTDPDGPNSLPENITLCVTLGYYIFESLYSLFNRGDTHSVMFFHHVVTSIGLATLLYYQQTGTEANIMLGGTEITTPILVTVRYIFKRWGRTHILKCAVLHLVATCIFITFRLVLGSYVMYIFVTNPKPMLTFKIFGMAIYMVGWPFTYSILQFGMKNFLQPLMKETETKMTSNSHKLDQNSNGTIKTD